MLLFLKPILLFLFSEIMIQEYKFTLLFQICSTQDQEGGGKGKGKGKFTQLAEANLAELQRLFR
jgi:hypothetical protein